MRHLFIAFIALSTLMVSCSKPTQEELIEKVFKEYVNNNFDDPNDLKEIISITIEDTLSAKKTISFVENILENSDSTIAKLEAINDSLRNQFDSNFEKIEADKKLISKYYGDKVGLDLINKLINNSKQEVQYLTSQEHQTFKLKRSTLEEAKNTLKKDSTFIVTYEIKTRILGNDEELEIKKYYAQTTSKNKINIFDNNYMDSYPKIYSQTYKEAELYTELYKKRTDILFERISLLHRAITFYRVD